MRKRCRGRKFSRKTDQRKAFLRALTTAFFLNEKIKTTEARAKEIRKMIDKFIKLAKIGDLNSRKLLLKFLNKKVVDKLIKEVGPKCQGRTAGYVRIVKLGQRKSDGAKMVIMKLTK